VFRRPQAEQILHEVLCETRKIYEFKIRELRDEDDRVSFCINVAGEGAAIRLNRGQPRKKNVPILKNLKKISFFRIFLRWIKAKRALSRFKYCGEYYFPKN
jgi:phosphoribosylaminoimidazole (AIR) synthetase